MATVSACRFVRNIVLARMLLPADFGVGATFALTLTFLELITELGPAKQLVQAKEGGRADWLAVAHAILAARGTIVALAIFAAAGSIAGWLKVPEATAAFQCLALAPFARGFEHLDACWFQRDLKLLRLSLIEALPAVAGLVAAPFAAWALNDYRAFLVVTLISAGGRTLVSHAVAERPYRWSIERPIVLRFLSFGWPLIGNSFVLFLILHGERFLVANWFDLATLGAYSVALSLAFTPAMMTARLHGSVALPMFSRCKENAAELRRAVASSSQLVCLAGGLLAMLFVLAGSWMIGVLYSEKYLIAQQVVPWIGALCAVRVARCTPSMLSIALGDTKIPLYSNLARAASFGVAALLLAQGFDVVWAP
ncbi:MAG: oligosaccharide flippase family protein, partial [Planctomycetota bacterium]